MPQHPRALRVAVLATGGAAARSWTDRLGAEGGRLEVGTLDSPGGLQGPLTTLRTLSSADPDVLVVLDRRARSTIAAVARYRGVPVVDLSRSDGDHEISASRLAELAGRPGAGVQATTPISVVVPVLDEIRVIDKVLDPLLTQLRPCDEIVVVDSGSVDGTRERLAERARADARLTVVAVPRCTIAGSRNHGVRAARHDLIACTDAGCEVDPGWLEAFRSAAADCPAPPLLVGVFRAHVGARLFEAAFAAVAWPDPDELRRASLPWRLWLRSIGPQYSAHRVDGRSVCFTRETFQRAGGFREDLFTAEDEAFGRDAVAGGAHPLLVAEAAVTWFQRSSARLAFRQFRGYGRGAAASGSRAQRRIDAVRAGGYLGMLGLSTVGGPTGRRASGALLAGLLLFPALRVLRRRQSPLALTLLLPAQLVKDVGKLTGTVEAVALGRTGPLVRPE